MTKRHGAIASQRIDNLTATVAPTATDDINSNYDVGSVWISTTTNDVWICVVSTANAAVWKLMTVPPPTSSGTSETLGTILPIHVGSSLFSITPTTILATVVLWMMYDTFTTTRATINLPGAGVGVGKTVRLALYDFAGTKLLDQVFSAATSGEKSVTFSALTLTPGYYYALICRADAVGGTDLAVTAKFAWGFNPPTPVSASFNVWAGTVVVVAGVAPSPLDPTAITVTSPSLPDFRLD
jgi:hypothetical protein